MAAARVIEFPFAPLPVHRPFHASVARRKAAIGGLGSGKSRALCMEAIRFALSYPGANMLLTRRTVPDLRRSTEKELFEAMPSELEKLCKISRLGGHVDTIRFPNHSVLTLAGMEDWKKFKSTEYAWIGIDEASEQTRENIDGIYRRLRQHKPLKGAPPLPAGTKMVNQMALASNPEGQDHMWSMFVNPETRYADSTIHLSTPMDNPFLDPAYLDSLLQMPLPLIRRYVECKFDAAAGRIYEEWGWDTHVVPVRKPGGYGELVRMSMDPGILNPTAALWCEVDRQNGRLVAVAEYQEAGRSAAEHTRAWRSIESRLRPARVVRRIADPSIVKRDSGTLTALSDTYDKLGYRFESGPVQDSIRIPALANLVATKQFVVTEACPRTYEQINNARWTDQAVKLRDFGDYQEKMQKGGDDHLHDCAQYHACIYVAPTRRGPEPRPEASTYDEVMEAWHRERRDKLQKSWREPRRAPIADGVVH